MDYLAWRISKSYACAVAADSLKPHGWGMINVNASKSNSSRLRPLFSRSASDYEIDEALWAAYRRYDKSAVTEQLLRRYLTALAFLLNESTARTADRQPGGGN